MLNSRLIRPQDADLHFEVLSFLIQTHGLPHSPVKPIQLHKAKGFEALAWGPPDTRSVFDWAEDKFGVLAKSCHMEDYELCLVANEGALDANQIAAQRRLDSLAAGQNPYFKSKTTPILYDPRDATEPGHFASTTILQLGELRAAGFISKMDLSPIQKRLVTVISAVYNSQGFVLAHLPGQVSAYMTTEEERRAVPHKYVMSALCFASCLALRVRGETEAQIIENYSDLMPKNFRRKIRQACKQIKANGDALTALKTLNQAGPKHGSARPLTKQFV